MIPKDGIPGIYLIKNKVNGKCYVGASKNLRGRKRGHLSGRGSIKIKDELRLFPKESFEFSVLEQCKLEFLSEREIYYIELLNPEYNLMRAIDGKPYLMPESRVKQSKVKLELAERKLPHIERKLAMLIGEEFLRQKCARICPGIIKARNGPKRTK